MLFPSYPTGRGPSAHLDKTRGRNPLFGGRPDCRKRSWPLCTGEQVASHRSQYACILSRRGLRRRMPPAGTRNALRSPPRSRDGSPAVREQAQRPRRPHGPPLVPYSSADGLFPRSRSARRIARFLRPFPVPKGPGPRETRTPVKENEDGLEPRRAISC